jgi:hypothetical protein
VLACSRRPGWHPERLRDATWLYLVAVLVLPHHPGS